MCWTVAVFSVFCILFSSVVAILSFRYCAWFNLVLCVTSQSNYRNVLLSFKHHYFFQHNNYCPSSSYSLWLTFKCCYCFNNLVSFQLPHPLSNCSVSQVCLCCPRVCQLCQSSLTIVLISHFVSTIHFMLCRIDIFSYPNSSRLFFFHSNVVCPIVTSPRLILKFFFVIVKPLVCTVSVKFYCVCLFI